MGRPGPSILSNDLHGEIIFTSALPQDLPAQCETAVRYLPCGSLHHSILHVILYCICSALHPKTRTEWASLHNIDGSSYGYPVGNHTRKYQCFQRLPRLSTADSSALEATTTSGEEDRNPGHLPDRTFVRLSPSPQDLLRLLLRICRGCVASVVGLYYRATMTRNSDVTWELVYVLLWVSVSLQ